MVGVACDDEDGTDRASCMIDRRVSGSSKRGMSRRWNTYVILLCRR